MCRAEFASIFEEERVALGGGQRHAHFRETMQNVLIVIHLIIVVALVGVVLLQRSEGGGLGMGSGGGGGVGGFMTGRGQANALTRATAILAGLFFLTSLLLSILAGYGGAPTSLINSVPQQPAPAGQSAPPQGTILDQLKRPQHPAPPPPSRPAVRCRSRRRRSARRRGTKGGTGPPRPRRSSKARPSPSAAGAWRGPPAARRCGPRSDRPCRASRSASPTSTPRARSCPRTT